MRTAHPLLHRAFPRDSEVLRGPLPSQFNHGIQPPNCLIITVELNTTSARTVPTSHLNATFNKDRAIADSLANVSSSLAPVLRRVPCHPLLRSWSWRSWLCPGSS